MSRIAFDRLWSDPSLRTSDRYAILRARCRADLGLFAATFFPDRFDLPWSTVHREMLLEDRPGWRERGAQQKGAWIAPRGSAKTTIESFLTVVHDILYGNEVCIGILSTDYSLAEDRVKDLYAVLSDSSAAEFLHRVYGPIHVAGTQTCFRATCPTGEALWTEVGAYSMGGTVRGHQWAGHRFSRWLLDDVVNPHHVASPTHRAKDWRFVNSDVLRSGWKYTRFDLVGTIVHPDDTVARTEKSPGWRVRRWQNLVKWPDRTDLWERCRAMWANLDDPHRIETARAFYDEHRAEMDAGADVLWPEGRPLWDLMTAYWENPAAFYSEDQNAPRDPDASLFDLDRIRRCRVIDSNTVEASRGVRIDLRKCEIGIWLDHSGGGKKSDFGAVAVVAREPAGWAYVLETILTRRAPSEQHTALWATWERWRHLPRMQVAWDATGTQGLLDEAMERLRDERRRAGEPWDMPGRGETLTEGKSAIDSLEPHFHNGWLELADTTPGDVLDQIRDYPTGRNDDGPDAIHKAMTLLSGMPEVSTGYMTPSTW